MNMSYRHTARRIHKIARHMGPITTYAPRAHVQSCVPGNLGYCFASFAPSTGERLSEVADTLLGAVLYTSMPAVGYTMH